MPSDSFHKISQSLRSDNGFTSTSAIVLASGLALAWFIWSIRAHVTQYEVSKTARLEVSASAYPVQSNTSGRLARSNLFLGGNVKAGDVLAEIDSSVERST